MMTISNTRRFKFGAAAAAMLAAPLLLAAPPADAQANSVLGQKRIDGRREDFVITRSGAMIGRLDHVFKDMVHIREAQIRQELPGQMTVCIVRGPGYTDADERQLRSETYKRTGDEVAFTIQYVDELPRTPSGKVDLTVVTSMFCDRSQED